MSVTYTVQIERRTVEGVPLWLFCQPGTEPNLPVLVLHGLNSRKERHLELCLRLADAGLLAAAMDLRSHGDRRDDDSSLLLSDRTSEPFITAFGRCVLGTVADVERVATGMGWEQFAVVGHSMGGYVALQTARKDKRIGSVVVISGAIAASGTTADGGILHDIPACASDFYPRPLLFLHGTEDSVVPYTNAEQFYQAFRSAYGEQEGQIGLIAYPGIGHTLEPEMLDATIRWIGG
jgi:hypothetical protein